MSEYKIEKKIPIPPTSKRNKYPFSEMALEESFPLDGSEVHQARAAASWYGKKHNRKFAIRKYRDGYRCWRVE